MDFEGLPQIKKVEKPVELKVKQPEISVEPTQETTGLKNEAGATEEEIQEEQKINRIYHEPDIETTPNANLEKSIPLMPAIDLEKISSSKYYWHATLTGKDGSILDNIIADGLQPKEKIDRKDVGNYNTISDDSVYVADKGVFSAYYLKNANDFNYDVGGLPVFVSVKVGEKDTEYQHDTDMSQGIPGETENILGWFSLLLTYNTADEFLDDNFSFSYTAKVLQKKLLSLRGTTINESKEAIWRILNSSDGPMFLEGQRLRKYLEKVDVKRWDRFLTILNKISPTTYFTGNLARKGGWTAEELKRVYVVTPNGDPDWRKWAKLIPPEIVNKWEEWGKFKDKNGDPIPGNGKMIRVR